MDGFAFHFLDIVVSFEKQIAFAPTPTPTHTNLFLPRCPRIVSIMNNTSLWTLIGAILAIVFILIIVLSVATNSSALHKKPSILVVTPPGVGPPIGDNNENDVELVDRFNPQEFGQIETTETPPYRITEAAEFLDEIDTKRNSHIEQTESTSSSPSYIDTSELLGTNRPLPPTPPPQDNSNDDDTVILYPNLGQTDFIQPTTTDDEHDLDKTSPPADYAITSPVSTRKTKKYSLANLGKRLKKNKENNTTTAAATVVSPDTFDENIEVQ